MRCAQEVREIMAELGFRTVEEMVGRTDRLEAKKAVEHWKARGLDFSAILYQPETGPEIGRVCKMAQDHGIERSLDMTTLMKICELAIEKIGPIIPTLPPGSTTIFFSLNDDMALGTLSQFRLADRADEVRIAAQGADASSWAEMACFPNWMADTAYFPERYGRSTVPAIIDILDGNEVQNPIFTPAAAITPANVLDIYPQTTELYPETADC